jgi:hypothetical protein
VQNKFPALRLWNTNQIYYMMILIAGPYRGGTNDDPELMKKNLEKLESVALPIFRLGHVPMIGEWVALPLLGLAGSKKPGDDLWNEIQYPVAHRLLEKCDAVLRLEGYSQGADNDVRIAKERGLKVYYRVEDIPPTLSLVNVSASGDI